MGSKHVIFLHHNVNGYLYALTFSSNREKKTRFINVAVLTTSSLNKVGHIIEINCFYMPCYEGTDNKFPVHFATCVD